MPAGSMNESGLVKLEELRKGVTIKGVLPECLVTVIDVKWYGDNVLELTYKESTGRLGNELFYRDREPALTVVEEAAGPWSFDADGHQFRERSE